MTFSKDLRFHDHVNETLTKVNKTLSPLYAIAKHLPRDTLDQIYKTYLMSLFDQCDTIYDGHITVKDAARLETIQNRAARLITGTLFRTPSDKLRKELGWDKLDKRRQLHRLLLYHKLSVSESQTIPSYIKNLIPHSRAHDTHMSLRNATHHTLVKARTTHQRSFFILTIKQWNQLPEAARQLPHKDFKKWAKKYLCTAKPSSYYSYGTKSLNIIHTRLRTDMSHLNSHMFRIQKTASAACHCGHPQENTAHFILDCQHHAEIRTELFRNMSLNLQRSFTLEPISNQLQILLHGSGLSGGVGWEVARCFHFFFFAELPPVS